MNDKLSHVSVEEENQPSTRRRSTHPSGEYAAHHLLVLEGLEAARKRPAMYIGSTDSRGLMHCLWEIIDNAVDEALAGFGSSIEIFLNADGSLEVHDHARGVPVDIEPKTGLTGVEVVFTKLHAGAKFGSGTYQAAGGLHGVGSSVVNGLASRMDVEVDRNSKTYAMSFQRGVPGVFDGEGPEAPFQKKSELRVIGSTSKKTTGTRVRYWPDDQIFLSTAEVSLSRLTQRARQTSFLIAGLSISVTDRRDGVEETEVFHHEGGITEFCEYLTQGEPVSDVIRLQGHETFTETVPMLDDHGAMIPTDVERDLDVDIALRWSGDYETRATSFVNIIATPKGGTHVQGFERGLTRAFTKVLEGTRLTKASDEIVKDDICEGMTSVVTVRLAEPQFEGQTKEVLGTPAVQKLVAGVVEREMTSFLTSSKASTKPQARAVMEKVVQASRTRVQARVNREAVRAKNALASSSMPPKLSDCRSNDADKTELFIVEGDSALGTAKLARNSEFQALMPIRGKILNVHKASVNDMLKNAECSSIIQVIGAGSGRSFDLERARYSKVIFMADADADGAHIRCLLATLFFTYLRPLVEAGRVYTAVPPLHRFELTNPKRGQEKYIYTFSDPEYQRKVMELTKKNIKFKEPQRYKGLGEMDADQLSETTMNPTHRTLRRLNISDEQAARVSFDTWMGNEVGPRKKLIIEGAYTVDSERIDV